MLALTGGLVAAVCFAASNLAATAAARAVGGASTVAWVALWGCGLLVLPVALFASPHELSGKTWWLLALSGLANVVGLRLLYHAYTRGPVGVVAAVASTEGMVVTLIAIVAGAHLDLTTLLLLVLVSVGIFVATAASRPQAPRKQRLPLYLAVAMPLAFGTGLWLTSKGASHSSVLWAALAPRVAGAVVMTLPLAAEGRISPPGRAAPLVALAAICETLGFIAYVLGSRHGVAVSAVAASQFSLIAAVGAYFIFGEVLSSRQLAGIALTAVGVVLLALTGG